MFKLGRYAQTLLKSNTVQHRRRMPINQS